MRKPCIVILGGVGPMAGVALHQRLVALAKFAETDQQHPDIVHLSYASRIPDRTEYVAGRETSNPGICAAEIMRPYIELLRAEQRAYRLVIPCATFHAPSILDPFFEHLGHTARQHFVDMTVCAAATALQQADSGRIGILATTGSVLAGVWTVPIEQRGGSVCTLTDALQEGVHNAIYDQQYGVKANAAGSPEAIAALQAALDYFRDQEVNTVIMGCTEIPLIADALRRDGLSLIDPLIELANSALFSAP